MLNFRLPSVVTAFTSRRLKRIDRGPQMLSETGQKLKRPEGALVTGILVIAVLYFARDLRSVNRDTALMSVNYKFAERLPVTRRSRRVRMTAPMTAMTMLIMSP